ncbi:PREDICTED: uncharacterized protein LOC105460821, partial [Wasmannia auropunctata]|uniref:uncharacterized protein LOC105460821 n=1 Tax=Wasmannia auropunctata TaxID=64793 RepID=UPI0005EE011F
QSFLLQLVENCKLQTNASKEVPAHEVSVDAVPVLKEPDDAVDENNPDKTKGFMWPDKAVLLLLELYREREQDFLSGMKRNNKIWAEIAASIKETDCCEIFFVAIIFLRTLLAINLQYNGCFPTRRAWCYTV